MKDAFTGIRVTTNVTQERTSHSKIAVNDDTGSTNELVKKHSF